MNTPVPNIEVCLGQRPLGWPGSCLYFANLKSIFYGNSDQTQALLKTVPGIRSYGGRLAPILDFLYQGGNNLLVAEASPDPELCEYFTHTLQLKLPRIHTLSHEDFSTVLGEQKQQRYHIDRWKHHDALHVDSYVVDPHMERLGAVVGKTVSSCVEGSRRGNNKLLLWRFLHEQALPVPSTYLADDHDQIRIALRRLETEGFVEAVVKSQIGASGVGMLKLPTHQDAVVEVPDYFMYEGACLVQGWLAPGVVGIQKIYSPSVQLFLNETTLQLYDHTEQILNVHCVHQGNLSPSPLLQSHPQLMEEVLNQARCVGGWLHRQGHRGTASVDFLVVEKGSKFDVYVAEINARVTGATYPSILARHFMPKGAWLMRNIQFNATVHSMELLNRIRNENLLFQPDKPQGILPINFNLNKSNTVVKGQFLILGPSTDVCLALLDHCWKLFDGLMKYDRD